ncbi:Protein KTI12-like protein [Bienertia sinuspersici]
METPTLWPEKQAEFDSSTVALVRSQLFPADMSHQIGLHGPLVGKETKQKEGNWNIKGYRYELWFLARAAEVRYCVLYCDVEEIECRKWNEDRKDKGELTYNEIIFEDLVIRFEKPDSRNRWDSTLFELQPSKDGYSNPRLTLWMMSRT